MTYVPDGATSSIFASLVVNGALGIIFYSIFLLNQHRRDVYTPKLKTDNANKVAPPPPGHFAWVKHVLSIDDEETLRVVGLDGYIFLRFIRLLSRLLLTCSAIGLPILLPVYGSAGFKAATPGIQQVGMGNLDKNDPRIWASLLMAWVFFSYALYLLYEEYRIFADLRQDFMKRGDPEVSVQTQYSCMLENLPEDINSEQRLTELLHKIYPNEVHSVVMTLNTKKCDTEIAKRNGFLAAFEKNCALREAAYDGSRPTVSVVPGTRKLVMCYGGEKVDAIDYYVEEILESTEKIREIRAEYRGLIEGAPPAEPSTPEKKSFMAPAPLKLAKTAFVTFTSNRAAIDACQRKPFSNDYPAIRAIRAPAPREMFWTNVTVPERQVNIGGWVTGSILTAGLLFWGLIIAFIGAVSNLHNIATALPFVNDLDPVSYSLLSGLLPVIVLAVFLALLPMIIGAFGKYITKLKTIVDIQDMVAGW